MYCCVPLNPQLAVHRYCHYINMCTCSPFNAQLKKVNSKSFFLLQNVRARTVLGKTAFMCAAPLAWNNLQQELKLSNLIPLHVFKARLNEMLVDTIGTCKCL